MDSTLAQGVLERLDAVTAKMGVAAGQLWDIWLATSWRPLLDAGIGLGGGLLLLLLGALGLRLTIRKVGDWEDDATAPLGALSVIALLIGGIVLALNLFGSLPDAIAYYRVPEVYALDQLRGLIGR